VGTELSVEERRLRQRVFAHTPEEVVIMVRAMGPLPGLEQKVRDEEKIEQRHREQAKELGVNADAYGRATADTGLNLFATAENPSGKKQQVRMTAFLGELIAAGYVFSHAHWYRHDQKGPVNVICFKRADLLPEERQMPDAAVIALTGLRFNDCSIWCNLKPRDGSTFRVDTINLAKGVNAEDGQVLHRNGTSYVISAS
jgi:hypothetical protein